MNNYLHIHFMDFIQIVHLIHFVVDLNPSAFNHLAFNVNTSNPSLTHSHPHKLFLFILWI